MSEEGESCESDQGWAVLPDVLLEEAFSYLSLRYLGRCSQVCVNWNRLFHGNRAWSVFVFRDMIFTKRIFTQHAGWQHAIDHWRLRFLINEAARKWRHLIIRPVTILFNLYEFLRVLTNFTEYYERCTNDRPLDVIKSFEFNWELHIHRSYGQKKVDENTTMYGTGGQILKTLTLLLSYLHGLKSLALRQLQLDAYESDAFMDNILTFFGDRLDSLTLLNVTKQPRPFMHVGLFLKLRKLVVSPQHLNDDVVILLSGLQLLDDLLIVQDERTLGAQSASAASWATFKRTNDYTRVHLLAKGRCKMEMIWQLEAPVFSIIYDNSYAQLNDQMAADIVANYGTSLQMFVQKKLERRYRSRKFAKRCDRAALTIASGCEQLRTFAIRERIATSTAVMLAAEFGARPHFEKLCLRRNALLKKVNWTKSDQRIEAKFNYEWLRTTAHDYDGTFSAIRTLIHGSSWRPMTDNEYLYAFQNRNTDL